MNKIFNNNNVYILGAGFSIDGNMPLIKNFLVKMRETAEWLEKKKDSKNLNSIQKVFEFRLKASGAAYRINIDIDDIEQLFSLATAKENTEFNQHIIESIASTLHYCEETNETKYINLTVTHDYLKNFPNAKDIKENYGNSSYTNCKIDLYEYIVANMINIYDKSIKNQSESNSFISFNYDTILEQSIWNLGLKVNYCLSRAGNLDRQDIFDQTSGLKILKLHGSLNWTASGTQGQKLKLLKNYLEATESNNSKILLPPTWQKSFSGSLKEVWDSAIDRISEATRIVIIGFSIPDTDIHFKYLLSAGLQDNISLQKILFINPMEKTEFRTKITKIFHEKFLDSGLIEHIQIKASDFFSQNDYLKKINR
ncbi:SIR2 family protein [Leptospira soteropolitanensis]|uniref:SIR2 family protein n=2 Tax=Leptospira soteropolitanensis TaxID=2950025 RepID=A0AAW5VM42_9LEPT|nr:SIR2 family protein [Leptospira soteropolitanensis]MCW7502292.1 SIR2 family protein [Leptospira soteropolitanensis]MCW7532229.1 SIR2 family protein [Leptospira soteropolitanensis]